MLQVAATQNPEALKLLRELSINAFMVKHVQGQKEFAVDKQRRRKREHVARSGSMDRIRDVVRESGLSIRTIDESINRDLDAVDILDDGDLMEESVIGTVDGDNAFATTNT